MSEHANREQGQRYSHMDEHWPMCGRPRDLRCDTCADADKPCYCDGGKP